MKKLIIKYRSLIAYVFFGVLTTCVNVVSYYILTEITNCQNIPATAAAWAIAVCFAFITNKLLVFSSVSFKARVFIWEFCSFYACRLLTGCFDLTIMYLAVDIANLQPTIWKTLSDILAIILNYIASKCIVFKRGILPEKKY